MNFEILPTAPERTGFVRVNLRVLREMLRLPTTVTITSIDEGPDGELLLNLRGQLPTDGELVATYDAIHTTIPIFSGFEPAT